MAGKSSGNVKGNVKMKLVVAGDVTVDWYTYPYECEGKVCDIVKEPSNWQQHATARQAACYGGAALLTRFLEASCPADRGYKVLGPSLPKEPIEHIPPDRIIHSHARLGVFPEDISEKRGSDKKRLRVQDMLGYIGPIGSQADNLFSEAATGTDNADIVVLDDAGNGFRNEKNPPVWPDLQTTGLIVYKMSRPLGKGSLWEKLFHADSKGKKVKPEKVVVVVNANDIRLSQGVNISKGLSWERTATDLVFQLLRQQSLEGIQSCHNLIVLFETDGALLSRISGGGSEGNRRFTLIYDPSSLEGGFASRIPGKMIGVSAAFTAALTSVLAQKVIGSGKGIKSDLLVMAVKNGLACSRALLETGFVETLVGHKPSIDFPVEEIFAGDKQDGKGITQKFNFMETEVQSPGSLEPIWGKDWRILDDKTLLCRQQVARDIVIAGKSEAFESVPVGKFGGMKTVDRKEIESYNAISGMIKEFLANPKSVRPLCIAVFGPPGAGKSYGVNEVLKSLGSKDVAKLTFNVSQFGKYQDLVAAFHKVRDMVLGGKVPCVFFDEFDSSLGEQPLGWLKYFLAPMQDGEFIDGESVYHIGKSILVFAGGTRTSYGKFTESSGAADSRPDSAKKEDFLSRLRGFINIMGPNRQITSGDNDEAYIVRRAMLLRSMLEKNKKAEGLFGADKKLNIDDGVLHALLNVTQYKHGTRSIEAIIDMCRLVGKRRYDLSSLPPKEFMDMHVDADEFMWLTERPRFQTMLKLADLKKNNTGLWDWKEEKNMIEKLAELIHAIYAEKYNDDPYSTVHPDKQDSSRDAAADIPCKLEKIGFGLRAITNEQAVVAELTPENVAILAPLEHERWCREKRLKGYVWGEEKSEGKKTHPCLKPFNGLDERDKKKDHHIIRAIPRILRQIGYEIFPLSDSGTALSTGNKLE